MRTIWRLCSVGLLLISTASFAHGPSRQKVTEEIKINAPAAKVWSTIKDFCSIEKWHPSIAKCEGTGGNEQGATRKLTLKGDGERLVDEELQEFDDAGMKYRYRITKVDVKVIPVTTYSSFITIKPDGDSAVVSWNGAFYRGYQRNNPPPELSDEAAIKAVTAFYKEGLENLKKVSEK